MPCLKNRYPGLDHCEEGQDPWHRDAFPDEFKDQAPHQDTKRKTAMLGIDWCGNVVCSCTKDKE